MDKTPLVSLQNKKSAAEDQKQDLRTLVNSSHCSIQSSKNCSSSDGVPGLCTWPHYRTTHPRCNVPSTLLTRLLHQKDLTKPYAATPEGANASGPGTTAYDSTRRRFLAGISSTASLSSECCRFCAERLSEW